MNSNILRPIPIVAALAICNPTQGVSAEPLASTIANKSTWTRLDWKRAELSDIWKDEKFRPYQSPSGSPDDDRFHKNQRLKISDREYNVSLVEIPLKIDLPYYLVIATDGTGKNCDSLVSEWSSRFGAPAITVDNSYKALGNYPLGETTTAWRLQNTIAISKCSTIGPTGDSHFHIEFRPASHPSPEAPVHLVCTRELLTTGANPETRKSPATAISIIPDKRVVVDASGQLMVSNVKVSYSQFEWATNTDSITQSIRIDRTTGALSGTATMKSDGRLIGSYQGECNKRAPGERRF